MANPSPTCTVADGSGDPQSTSGGVDVTPTNTVTVALASHTGVDLWTISIIGTDELVDIPTIAVNQTAKTATFEAPVAGSALNFKSTVNAGQRDREFSTTFGVYTTIAGYRVGAVFETYEGDPVFGWISKINALIRLGVGGILTADPVQFTSSRTRFGTSTAQAETVIGGVAVTDDTETEIDSIDHEDGVAIDYTAPCLVLDTDIGDVWRADYAATFGRFGVSTPVEVGTGAGPLNVRVTAGSDIETDQPSFRIGAVPGAVKLYGTGVVGKNLVLSGILQGQKVTAGAFTPSTAPAITSVTPNHGPASTATALTIDGIRFTGTNTTTGVKINGVNCTSIVVVDDTQITCTSPASLAAGSYSLTVDNGLGTDSIAWTSDAASSYDPVTDWGANLTLWAAGDNGDFVNSGGYVSQIRDASGNANHFNPYTSAPNQEGPYTASGINAKPIVTVGATASATGGVARYGSPNGASLKTLAALVGAGTAFTFIIVVKPVSITLDNATSYLGHGLIGDTSGYFGIYLHSRSSGVVVASIYDSGERQTTGIACPAGSAHVVAVSYDGTTLRCSVDGGSAQTIAASTPGGTSSDMYIGTGFTVPTDQAEASFAEFIVAKTYNATTRDAEIAALKTKYGIA